MPDAMKAVTGLIAAVSGLILALHTAGLLNRSVPTDGKPKSTPVDDSAERQEVAPVKPEVSKPESGPEPKPEVSKPESKPEPPLEYTTYYNMKYGFSVIYPVALLFPEPETSIGRRFKSLDGKVIMAVTAVDNSNHQSAADAYAESVDAIRSGPLTMVEHRLESKGFELRSMNGTTLWFTKAVVDYKYYRMLNMQYDESVREQFDKVWTRISGAFAQ